MKNRLALNLIILAVVFFWQVKGPVLAQDESRADSERDLVKTEMVLSHGEYLGHGVYFYVTLNGAPVHSSYSSTPVRADHTSTGSTHRLSA